jgi:hypothetical protein
MMRMAKAEVRVRPATSADIRPLAQVMARAFEDDPPFMWLLPDAPSRQARARRFFATLARTEALVYGAIEAACVDTPSSARRSGSRPGTAGWPTADDHQPGVPAEAEQRAG